MPHLSSLYKLNWQDGRLVIPHIPRRDTHTVATMEDDFSYDPSYSYTQQTQQPTKEEPKDYYDNGQDEDEEQIEGADFWRIIDSYFEGKGLVRQQLESFNEFIENTMQEIVDENSKLTLDQHTQYSGAQGDETVCSLFLFIRLGRTPLHSPLANFFILFASGKSFLMMRLAYDEC